MSASNKKKLRKEQEAAELTEKQLKEQMEAKKVKRMTTLFVVIMLAVALVAVSVLAVRAVNISGVIDRNTIAATIGEHELTSVEMNYFLTDHVRKLYQGWQSQYGDSLSLYMAVAGLDLSKPLDEQMYDPGAGTTWGEYFVDAAFESAKKTYALYDQAMAENFQLSETVKSDLEYDHILMVYYANDLGYNDVDDYLRAVYGYGSDEESFNAYTEVLAVVQEYIKAQGDKFTYTNEELKEFGKDKYDNYSSYYFANYYVGTSKYLTGGVKDGNIITYTMEDRERAAAAAKVAAESLLSCKTVEEFDKAIAALKENEESTNVTSVKNNDLAYEAIPEPLREWMTDKSRKENDITVIEDAVVSTDDEGNEITEVSGYYVPMFQKIDENLRPLANVRHLLVSFEGGTTDEDGNKTYSEDEMNKAKIEAQNLLSTWKSGAATEESFIALVKEHSDDGSAETGGLFEDIHRYSEYVPAFLNWSIDEKRKAGDTDVIATEYGYHVMYYVGDDELTYRDTLMVDDMKTEALLKWQEDIVKAVTITRGNTKRMNSDMIISYALSQ